MCKNVVKAFSNFFDDCKHGYGKLESWLVSPGYDLRYLIFICEMIYPCLI